MHMHRCSMIVHQENWMASQRTLLRGSSTCTSRRDGNYPTLGLASIRPSNWKSLAGVAVQSSVIADAPVQREKLEKKSRDTKPAEQSIDQKFVWRENWYPSKITSYLYKDRPNSVVLLNEDLVIWWGEDNEWHAARDKCPHKLAPLSEGRMDNGVLECRYHGWQFDGKGKCQYSPQAAAVPRACLETYPVQDAHGMLWIWPQSGSDAFLKASVKKVPVFDKFDAPWFPAFSGDYTYSNFAVDWSLMLDNGMDPSHAPCLHENGNLGSRKTMAEMNMKLEEIHPVRGIHVTHNGYTDTQHADGMTGERKFIPPCTLRVSYDSKSGSGMDSVIYMTPERPGRAHVFGKFFFKKPENAKTSRLKEQAPLVLSSIYIRLMKLLGIDRDVPVHNFGQTLLNQDSLMMHHIQQQMVNTTDKQGLDYKKFILASRADIGVGAFWRWVEKHGGGQPDWAGNVTSAMLPCSQSKEELFSQYERHTKHCRKCLSALAKVEYWIKGTTYCMALAVGLGIVFKNTPWVRTLALVTILATFLAQKGLHSFKQNFYGVTKLPDEE